MGNSNKLFNGSPSHSAMNRNTLKFIGIKSVKTTAIGPVRLSKDEFRDKWLTKIEDLGQKNK